MPIVSIIMTCYNSENTLRRAIESILRQTFKEFEFIIVNDGSSDNTQEILDTYASQDARIKLISQKNQGLAQARNKAVAEASGKYIAWMDSDDACSINRVEIQYQFMVNNPAFSACATNLSKIGDHKDEVTAANEFDYRVEKGDAFSHSRSIMPLGPHSMIERESFIKIGGYRTQRTIIEDLDFTLRYLSDYSYAVLKLTNAYFYTFPEDNPRDSLVKTDINQFAKRVCACFVSEWCRYKGLPDPVEENSELDDIVSIAKKMPIRDVAVVYKNISYLRSTMSNINNINSKESRDYLLNILSDNAIRARLIRLYKKIIAE